jgi:hypothetical protein
VIAQSHLPHCSEYRASETRVEAAEQMSKALEKMGKAESQHTEGGRQGESGNNDEPPVTDYYDFRDSTGGRARLQPEHCRLVVAKPPPTCRLCTPRRDVPESRIGGAACLPRRRGRASARSTCAPRRRRFIPTNRDGLCARPFKRDSRMQHDPTALSADLSFARLLDTIKTELRAASKAGGACGFAPRLARKSLPLASDVRGCTTLTCTGDVQPTLQCS